MQNIVIIFFMCRLRKNRQPRSFTSTWVSLIIYKHESPWHRRQWFRPWLIRRTSSCLYPEDLEEWRVGWRLFSGISDTGNINIRVRLYFSRTCIIFIIYIRLQNTTLYWHNLFYSKHWSMIGKGLRRRNGSHHRQMRSQVQLAHC